MPNYTQCAINFRSNASGVIPLEYLYNGPVSGMFSQDAYPGPLFITLEGCQAVCGSDTHYSSWPDGAATISTWVLPIIGILLQAPFESNQFFKTCLAIARWVGSPIASLSSILWNIKVTAKCALMVDMATKYEELPPEDSQFAQMRDSFYILSVMNQYSFNRRMPMKEAEKLLRVALFSDSLELEASSDESRSIVRRRKKLAKKIRESRKKGVVPVFISMMWFLFSLSVSIQAAFMLSTPNAITNNLALGLLLAWLPVLILCSIVDRNPVSPEGIRLKLNKLLEAVQNSLMNPELRGIHIKDFERDTRHSLEWITVLNDGPSFPEGFFITFAGQGRVRWHYGVAHPILAGIEDCHVTEFGRDWLRNAKMARKKLVTGCEGTEGLLWFDYGEFWQILASLIIVGCTTGGAFIVCYYTVRVGLGCRSGSFMIFIVIAFATFTIEMLSWLFMPENTKVDEDVPTAFATIVDCQLQRANANTWVQSTKDQRCRIARQWKAMTARDRIELLVLRPLEVVNVIGLCYVVLAECLGTYNSCDCAASNWDGHGGYMDVESYATFDGTAPLETLGYWVGGTVLSFSVMLACFGFVIVEWCTQSHLSTEKYHSALHGLRRTRWLKRRTSYVRELLNQLVVSPRHILRAVFGDSLLRGKGRRSLVWTYSTKESPRLMAQSEPTFVDAEQDGSVLRLDSINKAPISSSVEFHIGRGSSPETLDYPTKLQF